MSTQTHIQEKAESILVGGVNSPVRACKAVGGDPIYIQKAKGPHVFSNTGEKYIDYVLSWGPMILGHAHPEVVLAAQSAVADGTSFGATCEWEIQLAEAVQGFFPSCEQIRFVNSGTEACMSAIRLARGVTQREVIVKFEGGYHGHADSFLVAAGSGSLTLGQPDSAGVLKSTAENTRVIPYNDIDALEQLFQKEGPRIAGLIVEPVAGNMGLILPQPGFLEACRRVCDNSGALLIFDEVMTGFRVSPGGAQAKYQIQPDLTCLGKVIGGGFPCAAYGGRKEIMAQLAPLGPVYQAGTLSGNPVAMRAGLATLNALETEFDQALSATTELVTRLRTLSDSYPIQVNQAGTMFGLLFTDQPIQNLSDMGHCDLQKFARYFQYMKSNGIYVAPSQYEANFMSSQHDKTCIDHTVNMITQFLSA